MRVANRLHEANDPLQPKNVFARRQLGKTIKLSLNRWMIGTSVIRHDASGRALFRH